MNHHEVLSSRFAHYTGIAAIAIYIAGDALPQRIERSSRTGKMETGQVFVRRGYPTDQATLSGKEIDHTIGQTGLLEDFHKEVVAMKSCSGRLPDSSIPHHGRCQIQVGSNTGEIERSNGQNETFERTVLHPIENAFLTNGLIGIDLARIVGSETQEIDQLAGSIDLCLHRILALSEHYRSCQLIAIFG